MNLTESLGQEIIDRLSTYIDVPINLMNPKGIIIASTNKNRMHRLHEGAKQVVSTHAPCTIYPNDLKHYKNTQAGVNLPVFHRGRLTGVVGLTGHPDDVMQAAGMTQGSVEITLDQIYLQRQAFYEERQWIQWLNKVLENSAEHDEALLQEAENTFRVHLSDTWQVVAFQSTNPHDHLEGVKEIAEPLNPLVVLPYQHYIVCIVPFSTDGQFTLETSSYKIGVGEPQYGVKGIRISFEQARDAITLGEAPVSYSADLQLERLIHTIDQDIYDQTLSVHGKRLATLEPVYVVTLQALFRHNLRMTSTANDLHIHRNTLIYRIDQIRIKVGLDPRNFKEAALLTILLIHEPFVHMHK